MDASEIDELIRRLSGDKWEDEKKRREEYERRQWEGNRTSDRNRMTLKYIAPPGKNQNMRKMDHNEVDPPNKYMRKVPSRYKID